jgi:protein-disulfide isomerase
LVKQRGRQQAPARRFYVTLGIIAFLGAVGLIYVLTRPGAPQLAQTIDPNAPLPDAQPYVLGDTTAPVRIMEFADYQCPACAEFAVLTEPDLRRRIVQEGLASYHYYDFPLPQFRNSIPASLAAACADDQGRFWEMHDRLFNGQDRWAFARNPKGMFEDYAREIGLDAGAWEACYDDRRHLGRVQANAALGAQIGVGRTPTFVINGQLVEGALGYDRLRALVDSAAARAPRTDTANGGALR